LEERRWEENSLSKEKINRLKQDKNGWKSCVVDIRTAERGIGVEDMAAAKISDRGHWED